MLIVCPSCASEYTIDPAKLGADGRTVRCAMCQETWSASPARSEAPGAVFLPGAVGAAAIPGRSGLRVPLAAVAVLILSFSAWPLLDGATLERGSGLLREALLGPASPAFRRVISEVTGPVDGRVLVVTGEIVNETGRPIVLKPLEFLVRNGDEQVLATWTRVPPRPVLPPGEAVGFEASLAAPPTEGRAVEVHFTKERGAAPVSRSPL